MIFILVGSTVFSLVFRGVNGDLWVEHLLTSLPGGQLGFLIVVNVLVFVLAFFLDFFELAFILVPLLGAGRGQARHRPDLVRRAARREHADLVHASAVRLRAVLPAQRGAGAGYIDKITGKLIAAGHDRPDLLGRGAVRLIQVIMVALVIAFPGMVLHALHKIDRRSRDDRNPGAAAPTSRRRTPARRKIDEKPRQRDGEAK